MAKAKNKKGEDPKKPDDVEAAEYSAAEITYRSKWLSRFISSRNVRETPSDYFDGQTYIQRCESNRKLANTFIAPKKNKEDTNFTTGTVRQKLETYQSVISNLSLDSECRAFNDREIQDVELAGAMEDIEAKTNILDNDDEGKMLRQYVLLEQGEVYVREIWEEYNVIKKKPNRVFDGTLNDYTIETTTEKKDGRPTRRVLLNENVYKGDITIYDFNKQPFIWFVEQVPYGEAEGTFKKWDRWKNVPRNVKFFSDPVPSTMYNENFSMTELQTDHVEICYGESVWENELVIIVNGVLMTPVGLPLPRKWGPNGTGVHYDVAEQILGFTPFFGYGKGIPARLKTKSYLLDESIRLGVLKMQQSFQPAVANNTGVILSSKVFMPGKIANGLDGTKITKLNDPDGPTKSELQMIQSIQQSIDSDAASPMALNGQSQGGRMSATQSLQIKQNAELILTLSIFAATMLEKKLGDLRKFNILENWFDPIDQSIDTVKGGLKAKYRTSTVDKTIEGEGPGQSITEVTKDKQDPIQIYKREERLKQATGKPTRIKQIDPEIVKSGKFTFYTVVSSKPKKTSDMAKVLFNEMLNEAKQNFPNLNLDYMAERFAGVWGENPSKMFSKQQQGGQPQVGPDGQPIQPGQGDQPAGGAGGGQNGARGKMLNKQMMKPGIKKPTLNTVAGGAQ